MSIDYHAFRLVVIGFLVIAVLVITIRAIWQDYRRRREVLTRINMDPLDGLDGFAREGRRSGWNYRVDISNRYRELEVTPPLRIRLSCIPPFRLLFRRKNSLDRFFGRFHFFHPVQTHDPEFDQSFSIIFFEWDPGSVETWLSDTSQRVLLKNLMTMGCEHIRFDNHEISIEFKWRALERQGEVKTVLELVLGHMVSIAEFLSHAFPTFGKQRKMMMPILFLAGIPLALLLIGEIASVVVNSWCPPLEWGRIDMHAALVSLPLLIVYFLPLIPFLKKRVSSYLAWTAIVVFIYGGFFLTGRSLLAIVNASLDTGAGIWREELIVQKELDLIHPDLIRQRGRLHTTSWRGHKEEIIPVTSNIFSAVRPGHDHLRLLLRPGRLGYTWINGIHLSHPITERSLPVSRH